MGSDSEPRGADAGNGVLIMRLFGWSILGITLAFVVNNFLTYGAGLPGSAIFSQADSSNPLALLQLALYGLALIAGWMMVLRYRAMPLRADSERVSSINTFFIRAAFWAVLLIGVTDITMSFLRIEGFLDLFVGEELTRELGRSQFRGPYVHMPLLLLSIVIACFTRTLGFHWLALLIVIAELLIVFARFIFSYEQAFMADLVRFWYGALFLFASAYTLLEEGHVRVDVFYASFAEKSKGLVNMIGSLFMGITLCWTILIVGMGTGSSIINSPMFNFETTQSGFGMYVKYMMAAFLGVFAISMMIQFVSYMFEAYADYRGDPGKRKVAPPGVH